MKMLSYFLALFFFAIVMLGFFIAFTDATRINNDCFFIQGFLGIIVVMPLAALILYSALHEEAFK